MIETNNSNLKVMKKQAVLQQFEKSFQPGDQLGRSDDEPSRQNDLNLNDTPSITIVSPSSLQKNY